MGEQSGPRLPGLDSLISLTMGGRGFANGVFYLNPDDGVHKISRHAAFISDNQSAEDMDAHGYLIDCLYHIDATTRDM